MCVSIFFAAFEMWKCLCVKYPLFLSNFNETWRILSTYFRKKTQISPSKVHQNPSSGSRVVPCRRRDTTKLTVAFRNLRKATVSLNMEYKFYVQRTFFARKPEMFLDRSHCTEVSDAMLLHCTYIS